jgi:hypothetical protein
MLACRDITLKNLVFLGNTHRQNPTTIEIDRKAKVAAQDIWTTGMGLFLPATEQSLGWSAREVNPRSRSLGKDRGLGVLTKNAASLDAKKFKITKAVPPG